MIERIIYVSRAAPGIGARDAYDIIRTAHNRNSRLDITGALVFIDDHFVQVLEGERLNIRERFAIIAADARHTNVQMRDASPIGQRCFPHDWMALRHGSVATDIARAQFAYKPGFPADRFPPARLLDFVRACCSATATSADDAASAAAATPAGA